MRAVAYVNHGRWVADCPRPDCPSAEHFGRPAGVQRVGGLTGDGFACSHCGLRCAAEWPPNVDDIMFVLGQRPVPDTRNWRPPETVHDLFKENLEHGILPSAERGAILGDHFTDRELLHAARPSIGR